MKRSVVDYRKLRLSNINTREYTHLKLLLGWPIYFLLFYLTEKLIPAECCTSIHCALDDRIPFCEWFVIPYIGWYFLIVGTLVYFLLYNTDLFCRVQIWLMFAQALSIGIYFLFPSRQDLRPAAFERDNIMTKAVALIYSLDTNTGVCPSMHVAFSIGICSAWLRDREVSKIWKTSILVCTVLICTSVVFVKQHSVMDIVAAVPVCALAEWYVYFRIRQAPNRFHS